MYNLVNIDELTVITNLNIDTYGDYKEEIENIVNDLMLQIFNINSLMDVEYRVLVSVFQ